MRRIAFARPSCSGRPKNRSYTDAIFSYTPSTNDVSSEIADSDRVAASVVAAKSLSSSRGKSSAITPPSRTISDRQPLVSKGLAVEQEVGVRDFVETDRRNALSFGDRVQMMVSEEVQPRMHCGQHFIDRRLASIFDAAERKWAWRLMGEEDVDAMQRLTRVNLLMYKMASPVVVW